MLSTIDWIGVLVATLASMAIGAGWYGALAGPWIAASRFTDAQIARVEANDRPAIYAVAAACHLVMAAVLCALIAARGAGVGTGFWTGVMAWLGFVATSMCVNHRFQFRSWSLTAIDSGHYLVVLVVQGVVLGWFLAP